ncbi:MAG: hypothetical protein JWQ79_550 [Mucilaginibacter sp.]|nr:hypothetical protein [Mucilaginibacter sp.]
MQLLFISRSILSMLNQPINSVENILSIFSLDEV